MDNPLKDLPKNQRNVLIVVGVGAVGYVAWRWMNNSGGETESVPTTSSTDDEMSGTGIIGSNVGGSENVGNSSNTETGITSNDKWYSEAVDRLANAGWNAQAVQSALGEFLTGQSLDAEEARIVRAAVGAMGGYPPNGPNSVVVTPGTTDASKLKAPTNLKVTGKTATTVSLSWSPVEGAKEYRVYRSGSVSNVGASADTKIQIGGLTPGKSYTFSVAAGLGGGKMGPRSTGVNAKTEAQKLVKPTGLKISSVGKTSARLTWSPTYPNEYLIRRSGSSQTWESVDAVYAFSGLKSGTKYSVQVAAVSPGTRTPGPWSNYVSFTTKR
jgi:hypothetical protein